MPQCEYHFPSRNTSVISFFLTGFVIFVCGQGDYEEYFKHPIYWMLLSFFTCAIGLWLAWTFEMKDEDAAEEKQKMLIEAQNEALKKRAQKISVDLHKYKLIVNYYSQTSNRSSDYEAQALDSAYSPSTATQQRTSGSIRIRFRTEYAGEQRDFFSSHIPMQEATIRWQMEQHPIASLYVVPENPEEYFFDVSTLFLNQ